MIFNVTEWNSLNEQTNDVFLAASDHRPTTKTGKRCKESTNKQSTETPVRKAPQNTVVLPEARKTNGLWLYILCFLVRTTCSKKKKEMTWNIQRYVNTEQVYSKGKWQEMLPFLNMASWTLRTVDVVVFTHIQLSIRRKFYAPLWQYTPQSCKVAKIVCRQLRKAICSLKLTTFHLN